MRFLPPPCFADPVMELPSLNSTNSPCSWPSRRRPQSAWMTSTTTTRRGLAGDRVARADELHDAAHDGVLVELWLLRRFVATMRSPAPSRGEMRRDQREQHCEASGRPAKRVHCSGTKRMTWRETSSCVRTGKPTTPSPRPRTSPQRPPPPPPSSSSSSSPSPPSS